MKNLLIGMGLTLIGQILIFFQTNGQFIWPWFKKNPLILSIGFGTVISYLFINGDTSYGNIFWWNVVGK
jgi:hypothetical protein